MMMTKCRELSTLLHYFCFLSIEISIKPHYPANEANERERSERGATKNVSSRLVSNYTNASARVPKGTLLCVSAFAIFFSSFLSLHILSSQSSSLSIFQMYFGAWYVCMCYTLSFIHCMLPVLVHTHTHSLSFSRFGVELEKLRRTIFTQTQYAHLRQMDSKCF